MNGHLLTAGAPLLGHTPCPCCGHRAGQVLSLRDGKTAQRLLTVACSQCGLGRIDPLPTEQELADWYTTAYRQQYKGVERPALRHVLRAGRQALERWRWVCAHSDEATHLQANPVARTLDIGASSGGFVALMQQLGFTASGIEPHQGYASYARQEMQLAVLSGMAVAITVGVYGLVAGIVKLDDGGLYLSQRAGTGAWADFQRSLGRGILRMAPWLMKGLSVVGTVAMFLVGGGILTHGVGVLHHGIEALAQRAGEVAGIGNVLEAVTPTMLNGLFGVVAGAVVLMGVTLLQRLRKPQPQKIPGH